MNSFLVVTASSENVDTFIQNKCKELKINSFDINQFGKELEGKSLGIEMVRKIQEKLFLKPLFGLSKALVIYQCQLLTIEAQNALLKMLEEPPQNTIIILIATSKEQLLPTILSRVSIEEIKEMESIQPDDKNTNNFLLQDILKQNTAGLLATAQMYSKNAEESLSFLEKLILSLRSYIIEQIDLLSKTDIQKLQNSLTLLQKTYVHIKTTNVSIRLALESCFLQLQ